MTQGGARTAILVAGMHRSGTSATAGALAHFGIALGSRMLEPGPDNPTGYWEHEDAVAIHDGLLEALDRRWDDIRPLPPGWRATPAALEATNAIESLVDRDFASEATWAVKDPRICRVLPLWIDALQARDIRTTALLVARHPLEVAASLKKRNGWGLAAGVLLWLRYVTDAVRDSSALPRTVIRYSDLIDDPVATLGRGLADLGVPAVADVEGSALRAFVDPGARHHRATAGTGHAGAFLPIAEQVYAALQQAAQGGDPWAEIEGLAVDFEHAWAAQAEELESYADMAQRLACAHAVSTRRLRDLETRAGDDLHLIDRVQAERDELRSQLTAQIRWSEDAAAKLEHVQAERDETKSQLTAQIRWSEEAAAKLEQVQAERDELKSQLSAQIRWSEDAAAKLEQVQAERDELNSQLIAQIRWSEEAAAELERMRSERDDLQSRHDAQLQRAEAAIEMHRQVAAQRDALSSEVDRHVDAERAAAQQRRELEAMLDTVRAELARLQEQVEQQAERLVLTDSALTESKRREEELGGRLDAIQRSRSWRLTHPLRALAKSLRSLRQP